MAARSHAALRPGWNVPDDSDDSDDSDESDDSEALQCDARSYCAAAQVCWLPRRSRPGPHPPLHLKARRPARPG